MVDSSAMLINGLHSEFQNTYRDAGNRQANSMLASVMDLEVQATNRQHDFSYRDSMPHLSRWPRGDAIATEGSSSVTYNIVVHNWGKRLEWHEDDREDDQSGSLMQDAAATGKSAALLGEQMFFDLLLSETNYLPKTITAPDGSNLFITGTRFEYSSGNTVSSFAASSVANCLTGYYNAFKHFRSFKDGKGEPLWTEDVLDGGVIIVCSAVDEKAWEAALFQNIGVAQATTAGTSNILKDQGRSVELWPTSRIATNNAYVILKNTPVKPFFLLNRRSVRERSSLGDMNNSDRTRTNGMEYVQWDIRVGAGINIPYGAVHLAA